MGRYKLCLQIVQQGKQNQQILSQVDSSNLIDQVQVQPNCVESGCDRLSLIMI